MLSVHFLAVFMHYQRFNTFAVRTRNCRLLQRHFRDVALTSAKITDITLSRMTLAPAAILCPGIGTRSRKECQNVEKVKNLGSYIPYGLFQTKGEICAKSGSDWFRNVNLYKVQKKKKTRTHTSKETNKTFSFIYQKQSHWIAYFRRVLGCWEGQWVAHFCRVLQRYLAEPMNGKFLHSISCYHGQWHILAEY